jgi:hypothetical protein
MYTPSEGGRGAGLLLTNKVSIFNQKLISQNMKQEEMARHFIRILPV